MEVSEQLKQISKDTFFYGLGSAFQRFLAFFLFPIYTRLLTQADFGSQDLIATAMIITTQFLVIGLDTGMARNYYSAKNDEEKAEILSTWFWFELLLSVPVCVLLIVEAELICSILFGDARLSPFFRLGIATLPFNLVAGITMMALRITFRSKKYCLISAASVLIQALSSIYLIAVMRFGLMGVFVSGMLAGAFQAILGLCFTHHQFRLVFSKIWLRTMLVFGIPMLPAGLSLWILNYSNRYFLVRLGTLSDIGLLSVALRIASILAFMITAFQTAWGPFAYSLVKDERLAKETYSKVLTYFLLISLTGTVGLVVFAREMILLLATSAYESSAPLVPWLCCGIVAWGGFYIVGMGYGIAQKNYHTMILTILAAAVNTGLNLLLIPAWGIQGAAVSTMIGNLVALCYGYFAGQHFFRVNYEGRKIGQLIGVATAAIVVGGVIDHSQVMWRPELTAYKVLLCGVFVVSLFGLKIISSRETGRVRRYLRDHFVWARKKCVVSDIVQD